MEWIEIIKLRSTQYDLRSIVDELIDQIRQYESTERPDEIKAYHNADVETDISIHIQWYSDTGCHSGSPLGLQLAGLLGDFGLIHHSVWLES